MWNAISNFFSAVGAALGLVKQRDAEKNAADVKAAAVAVDEQKASDAETKAVSGGDLEQVRKDLAE